MGGINSLSGLNNVNVDFRPTVALSTQRTDVQKTGNANLIQPQIEVNPENAQPVKAEAEIGGVLESLSIIWP